MSPEKCSAQGRGTLRLVQSIKGERLRVSSELIPDQHVHKHWVQGPHRGSCVEPEEAAEGVLWRGAAGTSPVCLQTCSWNRSGLLGDAARGSHAPPALLETSELQPSDWWRLLSQCRPSTTCDQWGRWKWKCEECCYGRAPQNKVEYTYSDIRPTLTQRYVLTYDQPQWKVCFLFFDRDSHQWCGFSASHCITTTVKDRRRQICFNWSDRRKMCDDD